MSPYFVAAGGLDFANQDLRVTQDKALFLEGQLGGGVELRLGRHFALSADVRWEGRRRLNDPAPAVVATRSVDGKPVHALSDQTGAQFRLAAAVYF